MKKSVYQTFKNKINSERRCRIISFEGIEGSGKSTQIKLLKKHYEERGNDVHLFREPGQTPLGESLRSLLLDKEIKRSQLSNVLLFLTSRAELITQMMMPLFSQEKSIILIDRYFDSTVAYQTFAGGFSFNELCDIHSCSPLNILPDLTLYLSIDYKTSLERQKQRNETKDYFESQPKEFYESLIEGFNFMNEIDPSRVKKIDAIQQVDHLHKEICYLCDL